MPVHGKKAVDRAMSRVQKTIVDPNLLEAANLSGTMLILNRMKELAPVKTGDYRRGLHMATISKVPGKVVTGAGTNDERGLWLEKGTKPHDIRPKSRRTGGSKTKTGQRALRFMMGGAVVFAKEVRHPGTSPRPHMGPAFEEKRAAASREVKDTLKAALQKMAVKGM